MEHDGLERECEFDYFTASGPGGQRRNRKKTGVRLTHLPTDIVVTATEERSQARNKQVALERLQEKLRRRTLRRKPRIPTKISQAAKEQRVEEKRRRGREKQLRKAPEGT